MLLLLVVCLLGFLGIAIGFLLWYRNYSKFFKCINEIPGEKGVPVLGNFFTYMVPLDQFFLDLRERSKTYFPIYKESILNEAAVSVYHPEDVETVLSSTTHNKKSRLYDLLHMWLGTGLLTSHGDKWKSRRKMLTPAFHFSILQNFIDVFNEETAGLIKNLEKNVREPFVDLVPLISEFTLNSMVATSMGISLDANQDAKKYKKAILDFSNNIFMYRLIRPWFYSDTTFRLSPKSFGAYKTVKVLHDFTNKVIKERKSTFSESTQSYATRKRLAMLDLLLTAKAQGSKIDDEGIREEVDTFLFEGHDTTSIAISFILLTLANHKQVQDDIRQEIIDVLGDSGELPTYTHLQQLNYTERCIKECLRLYPSVPMIARDAMEDFRTTTGHTIPKGAMVNVHIFDLHRNPSIYPDPEKFDPDRFLPENSQGRHPFAYVPFSAGPRNCIGQKFAMLELKSVLCGVLRRFVLEPVDRREDVVFVLDIVLRCKNGIRVKLLDRNKV